MHIASCRLLPAGSPLENRRYFIRLLHINSLRLPSPIPLTVPQRDFLLKMLASILLVVLASSIYTAEAAPLTQPSLFLASPSSIEGFAIPLGKSPQHEARMALDRVDLQFLKESQARVVL